MPRKPRVVAVGVPHQITQRGNNHQRVFLAEKDHLRYLALLTEECRACDLKLLGYCLMSNHVHLIAVPCRSDSLARALRRVHSRYAHWFNVRYSRSGHLWQNRFFSCCLGRDHLLAALAYVDLNPIRAGLAVMAEQCHWSSARPHVEQHDPFGLVDFSIWRTIRGIDHWEDRLRQPFTEQSAQLIRAATLGGPPLGEESFVQYLERQMGRKLDLRGRGRPKRDGAFFQETGKPSPWK
jgi:putative transposase